MRYLFQLLPHANVHYRAGQSVLGMSELGSMLQAMGINDPVGTCSLGGAEFLFVDTEALSQRQLNVLSRHSALLMMCTQEGELLRPLGFESLDYLPKDLAEVLKYKGKTSPAFTRMMINMACAAAGKLETEQPVTVLDPMCGKGTTLFCALEMGMNGVGLDVDRKDLQEATNHLERYCTMHRLKHSLKQGAETCGKTSVPWAAYTLADAKEHYAAGDTRRLKFFQCDTALAPSLVKKEKADVLIADLPYGVQHAPQDGRKPESFIMLMRRALPAWRQALQKDSAAAISFNTLTLKRETLTSMMQEAGFVPLEEKPYGALPHFVEQAVTRDVVIARVSG